MVNDPFRRIFSDLYISVHRKVSLSRKDLQTESATTVQVQQLYGKRKTVDVVQPTETPLVLKFGIY